MDDARLDRVAAQQFAQLRCGGRFIFGQARLGEVELVGAVDQLHCPGDMWGQIVFDADANAACPQERRRIAGA